MFKLWANAGKMNAFSNLTRQFTDHEIADFVRDMLAGSDKSAWMMVRDVLKKAVLLANPLDAASKFEGSALVATNPNMNSINVKSAM
eukprot:12399799-Karenia_brevis.AAC.1